MHHDSVHEPCLHVHALQLTSAASWAFTPVLQGFGLAAFKPTMC